MEVGRWTELELFLSSANVVTPMPSFRLTRPRLALPRDVDLRQVFRATCQKKCDERGISHFLQSQSSLEDGSRGIDLGSHFRVDREWEGRMINRNKLLIRKMRSTSHTPR